MQSTSHNSNLDAAGVSPKGGKWPVLAQLADVSQTANEATVIAAREGGGGVVDYRFDSPQRRALRDAAAQQQGVGDRKNPPRPFADAGTLAVRSRPAASILPKFHPFAPASNGRTERLVLLTQFLTLFVLFTIVGTLVLRGGRSAKPAHESPPSATTAARPVLEPQSLEAATTAERPAIAPTATGPAGTEAPRTGSRNQEERTSSSDHRVRTGTAPIASSEIVDDKALPMVQTGEQIAGDSPKDTGPPAIARLSGQILTAPTRHAQHDDHRSSLH